MAHTIVLIQTGQQTDSRTYMDFPSLNEALEAICRIYEAQLKENKPHCNTITYDIGELFTFVDNLPDLTCMVFQRTSNMYAPFPKEWIKEKIFVFLKREATKNARIPSYNSDNLSDGPNY